LFDKVQEVLRENIGIRNSVKNRPQGALLRHLLRCKVCGAAMSPTYTNKNNKKYRYYICQTALRRGYDKCATKTVNANDIEESITDKLIEEKILSENVWDSLISLERRNYLEDKVKNIYYMGDNISITLRSGAAIAYSVKLRKVWTKPKKNDEEVPKIPALRKNLILAYQVNEYIEKNKITPKVFANLANVASSRIYWLLSLLLLAPTIQENILNTDMDFNEKQINNLTQKLIWNEQSFV
jgi:site-specific DNA recombinase